MARQQLTRGLGAIVVALVVAALGPSRAIAQSPPIGLDDAGSRVRLDRVVVKLVPEMALHANAARGRSFAAAAGDPRAATLDDALARCGAANLRRVFRSFEDASGRVIDTTRARVTRLRAARKRPLGPEPDPAELPDLENFFVAEVPPVADADALQAVLSDLRANDWVAAAQPDFVYSVQAEPLPDVPFVPDDPYLSMDGVEWSEGSFGNDYPDLYGLRNLRALEAWDLFDEDQSGAIDGGETGPGEDIVVAVVDTGLDVDHPDIAGNVWTNAGEIPGNGIDDDGNGFVDDVTGWNFTGGGGPDPADGNGHGTHVSGTIAAPANGEGIVGIAPFARIMPLKGLSDAGSGSSTTLAPAIDYATAQQADVTSNSWGGIVEDEVIRAAFDAAEASGVLNVAAAGNDGSARLLMPGSFASTMAIAALDWNDVLASFSNFGPGTSVGAPGVRILSLSANFHANEIAQRPTTPRVGTGHMVISGTSMATPHASGAAAVLMSLFPEETAPEILGRLLSGAANIDAENPGHVGDIGGGRVDLLSSSLAVPEPLIRIAASRVRVASGGRSHTIDVDLRNFWSAASGVTASLGSPSPDVQVRQGFADLGPLAPGETKTASFVVQAGSLTPGNQVLLSLDVTDGNGGAVLPLPFRSPLFEDVTASTAWVPSSILASGARALDYDHDGASDFVSGEFQSRMRLFHNDGEAGFSLTRLNQTIGQPPHFFDVDGDGDRDLVGIGPLINRIFPNDGSGGFGAPETQDVLAIGSLAGVTVLDLEADGDLDIVAASQTFVNGRTVYVLENDGTGQFTDVWASAGLGSNNTSNGMTAVDYDDDGDVDVVTGQQPMAIYRNDGSGHFTRVTGAVPAVTCPGFTSCTQAQTIAPGDYDNDGDVDFMLAGGNLGGQQPALLLQNQGNGTFVDVTHQAGDLVTTDFTTGASGTEFLDVENDGDLDIYFAFNNVLLGSPERSLLPTNALFLNQGDGTFRFASDIAFPIDTPFAAFHGAMSDFDADGGIDLFGATGTTIIETGGVLRNVANRGSWIELELLATESPTDGYGTRILAHADGRLHRRDVHYSAIDPSFVHIGLGAAQTLDSLEVYWPSGIVQHLTNLPVNQRRVLREAEATCSDADADGICDPADNCLVHANGPWDASEQVDSDGDGFGNSCDADLDNDGLSSLADVGIMLTAVGLSPGDPGYAADADLDGDGVVSAFDLQRALDAYGRPPGPSGLGCADPTGATAPCTAE